MTTSTLKPAELLRLAWRLQRRGLVGMTAVGVAYGAIQASAYISVAGTTAAERAAFGRQIAAFGATYSYILPLPVRPDTISGYLQWRAYGALPLLFVLWSLMSASGATRGDEDRGLVAQWLAAGAGAAGYLASRFVAFALAAAIAVTATSTAIAGGVLVTGSALDAVAVVEVSLALLAVTLCCYAIAALVAQVPGSRAAAAGAAAMVLVVLFFLESLSRTVPGLRRAARLSPFYYYDRNTPLTPGSTWDPVATVGLLAAAIVLMVAAAALMRARDVGAPLWQRSEPARPALTAASSNPLLALPVTEALYEHRRGLLAWIAGTALAAAFMASVGRQIVDVVREPGALRSYLTIAGHGDPYVALTGFFWFGVAQLLLAAFAISQVAIWTGEDSSGRLEVIFSTPVRRWRLVLERFLFLLAGVVAVVGISSTAYFAVERSQGIALKVADLSAAALPLVPFTLAFASVGALLATRVPRGTTAILGALAFFSYLATQLGPLLKWPQWALDLSVFSLYGTPISTGVNWSGTWILVAVVVAGFAAGAVLMQRREVGS